MFCTKCGKKVDKGLKFCPECGTEVSTSVNGTRKQDSVLNKDLTANLRGKLWYKILSTVVIIVAGITIAYFKLQKANFVTSGDTTSVGASADADESLETTVARLLKESLDEQEELKPIARVGKVTKLTLNKTDRNKYSGIARVDMFPVDPKNSTDNNVKYVDMSVSVSYTLDVLYDKKDDSIVLNEFEIEDEDWAKLCEMAGFKDEEDEDDAKKDQSKRTRDGTSDGMSGGDFIRQWLTNPQRTDAQTKMLFNKIKGHRVTFENAVVKDVRMASKADMAVMESVGQHAGKVEVAIDFSSGNNHLGMTIVVSNPQMAETALKFNIGDKIKTITATVEGWSSDIRLINPQLTMEPEQQANGQSAQATEESRIATTVEKLFSLMEAQNKMTKEAVGWARNPLTDTEKQAASVKIAEMSAEAQSAMIEQIQSENTRLKEFLELGKIVDAFRKQFGASSFLSEQTVRNFVGAPSDKQEKLLDSLRSNAEKVKKQINQSAQQETSISDGAKTNSNKSPSTMTGADIVRENVKKRYNDIKIANLQKKLDGQMLTFENGEIISVGSDHYGVHLTAWFGEDIYKCIVIQAYFKDPDAMKIVEELDSGAKVKSIVGRVSNNEWIRMHCTLLTITDAKITLP